MESQFKHVYEWVDTFTLSQEKCDISKDFSDGVLLAEIIVQSKPKLLDLKQFKRTEQLSQKVANWNALNRLVLAKLAITLQPRVLIDAAQGKPGAIELILTKVKQKVEKKKGGAKSRKAAADSKVKSSVAALVNQRANRISNIKVSSNRSRSNRKIQKDTKPVLATLRTDMIPTDEEALWSPESNALSTPRGEKERVAVGDLEEEIKILEDMMVQFEKSSPKKSAIPPELREQDIKSDVLPPPPPPKDTSKAIEVNRVIRTESEEPSKAIEITQDVPEGLSDVSRAVVLPHEPSKPIEVIRTVLPSPPDIRPTRAVLPPPPVVVKDKSMEVVEKDALINSDPVARMKAKMLADIQEGIALKQTTENEPVSVELKVKMLANIQEGIALKRSANGKSNAIQENSDPPMKQGSINDEQPSASTKTVASPRLLRSSTQSRLPPPPPPVSRTEPPAVPRPVVRKSASISVLSQACENVSTEEEPVSSAADSVVELKVKMLANIQEGIALKRSTNDKSNAIQERPDPPLKTKSTKDEQPSAQEERKTSTKSVASLPPPPPPVSKAEPPAVPPTLRESASISENVSTEEEPVSSSVDSVAELKVKMLANIQEGIALKRSANDKSNAIQEKPDPPMKQESIKDEEPSASTKSVASLPPPPPPVSRTEPSAVPRPVVRKSASVLVPSPPSSQTLRKSVSMYENVPGILSTGVFVYVRNREKIDGLVNPRLKVGRVVKYFGQSKYLLQFYKETEAESREFEETDEYFREWHECLNVIRNIKTTTDGTYVWISSDYSIMEHEEKVAEKYSNELKQSSLCQPTNIRRFKYHEIPLIERHELTPTIHFKAFPPIRLHHIQLDHMPVRPAEVIDDRPAEIASPRVNLNELYDVMFLDGPLGMILQFPEGKISILSITYGGQAHVGGVQRNDVIELLDNESVETIGGMQAAVEYIRTASRPLTITFHRPPAIEIEESLADTLLPEKSPRHKIQQEHVVYRGWIRLHSRAFIDNTRRFWAVLDREKFSLYDPASQYRAEDRIELAQVDNCLLSEVNPCGFQIITLNRGSFMFSTTSADDAKQWVHTFLLAMAPGLFAFSS